jgi:hypothetical protein
MQELFRKDTTQRRTIVEREGGLAEAAAMERELMEASKEKVWKRLESRRRFRPVVRQTSNVWQRRFSIPLPAAAAAAVILVFVAAFWIRGGSADNTNYASIPFIESVERTNFILAAEEQIPGVIPAGDISSVLQYLGAGDTNIIILQLPESKNFFRAGEPVIRAADYTRR